jgi:hypothetical protein
MPTPTLLWRSTTRPIWNTFSRSASARLFALHSLLQQRAPPASRAPADLQPQSSGKRVIAFSVYGTKLRYLVGAIKNAILAQRCVFGAFLHCIFVTS